MKENKKVLVFFSGGISSYLAAKRCCAKYGAENVTLLFTDVNMEHSTLYKFVNEAASKLGCWLITLNDGRTPFEVFKDVGLMGNTRLDPCSRILKRELSRDVVEDEYSDHILCIGFDWSEQNRIDSALANWQNHRVIFPMAEAPYLTKKQTMDEVVADGLEIPYLYKIGMSHNNCSGFCVKAGQGHYAVLLREDKELYLKHEKNELDVYKHIGKTHPFLRLTTNGIKEYVTLRQFREHLESSGQCDLFDVGGCGCFSE